MHLDVMADIRTTFCSLQFQIILMQKAQTKLSQLPPVQKMLAHFLLGPNPLKNLTDFSNILSAYIKQHFKRYQK